jgi:two-component system response regulator HydG
MQAGAVDFIEKPFPPEVLRAKVEKALEISGERKGARIARARVEVIEDEGRAAGIVGDSEAMKKVMGEVRRVAAGETTVHISGESGTGKELVARALHDQSPRKDGPFVTVSCAALAETLLESELFGHERGSFTGAVKRKIGRFELADHGTLFLDEIGEIPPSVQVKLLRVLQERAFDRVGGEETIKVDVRLVSATNRDLKAMVDAGRFREDLYYRLHVFAIHLPPLRERPGDIPLLAAHFLAKLRGRVGRPVRGFSADAQQILARHRWPGNVRELENAVEQALVFAEGEEIRPEDLPAFLKSPPPSALPVPTGDRSLTDILEDLEKQLILSAYEKARGVKTETARLLGIKTSALYYKLEKYGIVKPGEKGADGE